MKKPTIISPTEQLEFKLNDKRKKINLDEEMENLKKLRAKNSRKRRIKKWTETQKTDSETYHS